MELTRKGFLAGASLTALGLQAISQRPARAGATGRSGVASVRVTFDVNGEPRELSIDPRVTLLDAARDHLGLTGAKKGCDRGSCGACTMLVNGRRVVSCLTLAVMHAGDKIVTIEGIETSSGLHPLQSAFIKHDAFQCGYCTPGQIVSACGLLGERRALDREAIRAAMSGNLSLWMLSAYRGCDCGSGGRSVIPFAYTKTQTAVGAASTHASDPRGAFIAGGTNILELMKDGVEAPTLLIDINALPLDRIYRSEGRLYVGALARMAHVAENPEVRADFPMLAEALEQSASPQLRNMASVGGNVMQRTRCPYFRDLATPCNKRLPGSGCGAIGGLNREQAVLGTSDRCIAAHASDAAVALIALEARVHLTGVAGSREMPLSDFYRLPGTTPNVETAIAPGELIAAVSVPLAPAFPGSTYLKVRDRAEFDFALVSVAIGLAIERGTISEARIALGGVGTVPWRPVAAERSLIGQSATRGSFEAAADLALAAARGYGKNNFKIPLAKRALARALQMAAEGA